MVNIPFDEQTASELQQQADAVGVSVAEYVRTLLPKPGPPRLTSWDEIKAKWKSLEIAGPSLPPDFSRADMYDDHD